MNRHETFPDEPPRATTAELVASDLVDGRTASSDPSVLELADRFRSIGAAIATPTEADPAQTELHIAAALSSNTGASAEAATGAKLARLPVRRSSRLLAAAAVVAVVTVGGLAVERLANGSNTAPSDSAVALGAPPTAANSAGDVVTAAPDSTARGDERDLGSFADVASLRIRLLALPEVTPAADDAPRAAGPESKAVGEAGASDPSGTGTGCPPAQGELLVARASVAGRDVLVLRSIVGVDRILDRATCEPAA